MKDSAVKLMRCLIIPDIHDKVRQANRIIQQVPHDRLVLLGDFFDDFQTGVTDAADTAIEVKRWLNTANTTCILGNHDMSYGWGHRNRRLICSGYDAAKWIAINAILTTEDWQRFKMHAWVGGDHDEPWLVTHAGFHRSWLRDVPQNHYTEFIDRICGAAWNCLNRGEHHPLLGCGIARSGDQNIGGINWIDWEELIPIPGLNQIVGHTPRQDVRLKDGPKSRNICLDTDLRHYLVFEDGNLEIRRVADLPRIQGEKPSGR